MVGRKSLFVNILTSDAQNRPKYRNRISLIRESQEVVNDLAYLYLLSHQM